MTNNGSRCIKESAGKRADIIRNAMKIDYDGFEYKGIGFDYEGMMGKIGYSMDEMRKI